MSSIFGWSYPPGCSSVPGDEPFYCEICGMVDDCCCPECPVCGEQGNKQCYTNRQLTQIETANLIRYGELSNEIHMLYQRRNNTVTTRDYDLISHQIDVLLEEQDAIDVKSFGHGLMITAEQIKSFNEAQDAMDEHWAERDRDLAEDDWKNFVEYEQRDDRAFAGQE